MGAPAGNVPAVSLFNRQRKVRVDTGRLSKLAVLAVVKCMEHPGAGQAVLRGLDEVEISVVSDRVIARVHRCFMDVPGTTDVITFDHGEIVLSANTAERAARENGETRDREVARYIVHGLLHLNGHEDDNPSAAAAMWQAQESVLQALWPDQGSHEASSQCKPRALRSNERERRMI